MLILAALAAASTDSPATPGGGGTDTLRYLLPPSGALGGWTVADSVREYEGEKLYDQIDGGADLFLEYGYLRSLAAEYQNAGGGSITLEIYQMADPGAAFGIYSVRSGENGRDIAIGQGGCRHPYYVMFWKGPFYVSLAASDSGQDFQGRLERLARAVDAGITVRGQDPEIMGLLPPDGLVKGRFIRGELGLSTSMILGLGKLFPVVDGAVGVYRDHQLLILRYSDPSVALERAQRVAAASPSRGGTGELPRGESAACFKRSDTRTLCSAPSGKYLVLTISPSDSVAEAARANATQWLRAHG